MTRKKISDEMLIQAVKESDSLNQVLLILSLTSSGRTYQRYKERIKDLDIDISHFTDSPKKKLTDEELEQFVKESTSIAGVLRKAGLKQAGGTQANIGKRIKSLGLDTSHFLGQRSMLGKISSKRKSAAEILIIKPEGSLRTKVPMLKRAMLESGIEYKCLHCSIKDQWNGKPITLEIDHIDGNFLNNLLDNLRFLCPNCHSQEETTNMPHKYRS